MCVFQYNTINITYHQLDEAVVAVVVSVLSAEEREMGVRQPFGIGRCPHPKPIQLF